MAANATDSLLDDGLPLLPSVKVPTPILRPSSPFGSDPVLNVTPEKSNPFGQFSRKGKAKCHVHFLLEGQSSKHQSGKDIFAEIKHPKRGKSNKHKDHNANKSSNYRHQFISESRKKTGSAANEKESAKTQPRHDGTIYNANLQAPQLHSTGALEQRLHNIELEEFNVEGAVAKMLEQTESVRNEFSERIAEAVNVPKDYKKYSGLVSIDVPADGVGNYVVEEKITRPRRGKKKQSAKPSTSKEPDIMECFRPDLVTDVADLSSASRLPHYKIKPTVVPVDSAFDIYRHIQQWQS
ncbi:protein phosphatase 1 regulatory subunit 35-like [Antedon mediterranea]|uniref:protein phosphatase 1 regulatory subunit 35-like n=1 Tax=Antedon mediterranea TaxID=105859 RepID=UPI003AF499D1